MKDAIVFFSVVFGGLLLWFAMRAKGLPRFRRRAVLTGTDLDFFRLLQRALPEGTVCPQVAVSALIEPAGTGNLRRAARADIAAARVGFAVFDEDMTLLAVIELDYSSRKSRKKVRQEACFESAGIRCLRFHARRLPSEAKLRSMIFSKAGKAAEPRSHFVSTDFSDGIEFRRPKTPWRNTERAHV